MEEATHKFKFEYDDSEESQYVRKLYGEKYLQETDPEQKIKWENLIIQLYRYIEIDRIQYERYMQLKTKQYVLSPDDIRKVKDIICDNFKGKTRYDGSEYDCDEEFLNKEFAFIRYHINRPILRINRHYGPLYLYSYESLRALIEILGKRKSLYKWIDV
jgi:hypothetical protein